MNVERKQISIEPHLGKLEWAKGTYPTPWGVIEVSHEKKADGKNRNQSETSERCKTNLIIRNRYQTSIKTGSYEKHNDMDYAPLEYNLY